MPIDERAVSCALFERKVRREALESSSAVLQTAARPSQLPAHFLWSGHKKTRRPLVTPGFESREYSVECHKRKRGAGSQFAG